MDLKSDKGKSLSKAEAFKEIRTYLEEQISLSQRKVLDESTFDKPAWSEYQAYQLGFQKAFSKLYNLIPDQGEIK
jgi:hypothetical protein